MIASAEELRRFTTAVEDLLGIRVSDRAPAMTEILVRRADHHASIASYIARVEAADAEELRALVTEVSVGETYFFRHSEQCLAYADLIVALAAQRGHVRVLSAGCSSGEEPYTLAMLARERLEDPRVVGVHAFDFNPVALARCAKARYTRWALRATTELQERRWFVPHGREVELVPEIKRAVTFFEANLLRDGAWMHEPWDLIFCRNVTMYFSDERAAQAVGRLVRSLTPGGYLFLGHAETLREHPFDLELCHSHGTFYYRRGRSVPVAVRSPATTGEWVTDIARASERVSRLAAASPIAAPPPDDPLAPIRTLIGEERFSEATDALSQLPEAVACDREARLYGAIVQAHTGANALAETTCRELLDVAPREARAHYLLALCRSTSDVLGAEHHAREALALEPRFAMASIQLAFLLRRAGAREQAGQELVRAIALIEIEDADRLTLFSGGFSRAALIEMCRGELARSRA